MSLDPPAAAEVLVKLDAIGFGSLNLDEFWEVPRNFLTIHNLVPGQEYVEGVEWFRAIYPALRAEGNLNGVDPGGSAANMIAALRRMGFSTGYYGAAGKADLAELRPEELGEADALRIMEADLPTGRCLAFIDAEDEGRDRALVILPNANDLVGAQEPDVAYFEQARWVHLTSFVSRKALEAQVKVVESIGRATRISFDPGAVYCQLGLPTLLPIVTRTAVLFVTEHELEALVPHVPWERAVHTLFDIGIETVVVKQGERGMTAFERTRSVHQPPAPAVGIKDRTGAGDVAAAGFLAGALLCLDLEGSLELAAKAASRSIEGYGRKAYPDRTILRSILSESKEEEQAR